MIVRLICRRKTLSPFLMHFAASPRPVSKLPRYLVFLALAGMMSGAVHGQEIHLHPADGSARVNAPGPNQIAQGGSGAAGFVQSGWSFEPNFGQDKTGGARSDARFLAYVHNYLLRLKPGRASLEFRAQDSEGSGTGEKQSTFEVKFVGSNQDAAIAGMERLPGKHSYLPSGDPASWTTGVPLYGRVRYSEIYPRTDLTFYANRGELEYDLVLNPKADPRNIQLELNGADHVQLQSNGDVSVTVNGSPVRLVKPSAYQVGEGERHIPVSVDYKLDAGDVKGGIPAKLTFSLGKYDRRRTLVIDPVVLYGAYIPGPVGYSSPPYYYASTQIRALTADANGNTYVAVSGVSTGAAYSIMKFDPNGNLLLNVSIGSPNTSISPSGIAVDSTGNIYVAGSTRSGLPVTPGAFQAAPPGNNGTGFLTVVKSDGSSLIYSSYFGSAGNTDISGLAVGPTGHAFIAGSNSGGVFPTTPGAYQAAVTSDFPAGFVAQFDPSASGSASLVWSTMLMTTATSPGQSSQSYGSAIAVDSKGDAYVISNSSPGFPLTSGAYAYSGIDTNGVYVTELDPGGDNLIYSAFLGPGYGSGIAVDGAGAAYVTGLVAGADFPVTPGAYQTNPTPGFAAKLSSDGSQLLYSTFLGNPGATNPPQLNPTSIALQAGCASACSAYIAGLTSDNNFPVVNPIQAQAFLTPPPTSSFQVPYTGFLVNLTPDGSGVNYSTYLGALGSTTIYFGTTPEIAADSSGNVYFASNVDGPDAPATLPSVQNPGEGFLTKIGPSNGGAIIAAPAAVTFLNTLTQSITLRNAGSAAVQLQRPFTFGSSEFSETDSCPSPMPGGSACTLNLTFTPTGNGPRSTTLTIASNAPNSPASVSLTVPTDQTNVNVSASALNFPDQVLNTYSDTQTVTITNEGSQAIPVGPITAGEPDYVITSNCPAQLGPGAHCAVNVTFKPTQIGLRAAALDIPIPGTYTFVDGYYVVGYVQIALTGTGVLSASGTGALTFSQSAINFGSDVVNTSTSQSFLVTNSGTAPVTINSIVASTTTGNGAPGDFSLLQVNNNYGYGVCGTLSYYPRYEIIPYATPFSLAPQASCFIYVQFRPSIGRQETGMVTISDSATGSPHTVSLSGVGLYSAPPLVVSPSMMTFPPQPVGDASAPQTFNVYNNGEDSVVIDRAVTTGDFDIIDDGSNCEGATVGACTLAIAFTPRAAGARTGTLTFYDSLSGTPLVFNLAGTGIQATGTLVLGQSSLSFPAQAKGTTSTSQEIVVTNPGNSPVTINALTASGDFAVVSATSTANQDCQAAIAPGATCVVTIVFSPTQSSGTETGVLTIHSTAGSVTASLSGTAIAAVAAVQITPTTVAFGGVPVGTTTTSAANEISIYVTNTGNTPVTFPNPPVIAGISPTPSADFSIDPYGIYCSSGVYIYTQTNSSAQPMPPGASCIVRVIFNPSMQAKESATFTLVDSAGTQTINLTGTGTSSTPVSSQPATLAFGVEPIGAIPIPTSQPAQVSLQNNGSAPIIIQSVAITAGSSDFSITNNYPQCAGLTIQPGSNCTIYVTFKPSVAGYRTGVVTFKDNSGNSYVTSLAGYAVAGVNSASLSPQATVLPDQAVGTSGSVNANFSLTNTGNLPLSVGTLTSTNVSLSGSSSNTDFFVWGYSCVGLTLNPGAACPVSIVFMPQSLGQKSGTVTIPVTYSDNSQATFTATVSGTGAATTASANLYPQNYFFSTPQVAPATSANYQDQVNLVLTNTGTVSLTVGNISGQDITATAGSGGDFVYFQNYPFCSGQTVPPGGNCNISISFAPLTAGSKTGSISLPVTYASGGTATFTASFSGTAVAPTRVLQVTPASANFNVEVVGTTDLNNVANIAVVNNGNSLVTFSSVSTNNPNFTVIDNGCNQNLYAGASCGVTVAFTPSAGTPPGVVNGVLSIADNATGSPQTVSLSGTAVSVGQQLGVSQTSVSFGSYAAGTTSPPQLLYLVDLGSSDPSGNSSSPSQIQINSIVLGGTNPSDFVEANNCGGTLGFTVTGRSSCEISVSFAPGSGSPGIRNANLTITPAQGSPLVVQLTGNAVAQSTLTGLQFIPVAPCRVADTRNAPGRFGGPELAARTSREFDIPQSACNIPSTAAAYSLNVTVVPNGPLNYLTLWPSGQPQPLASTLNSDGRTKANAAIVPAGTSGGVSVYASDATQVILDINGYFVPKGTASALAFYPLTPCRIADTRNPAGPLGGPFLGGGSSRAFPILSSNCNIPSAAQAYSLNVTAVPHHTLNYLTAWPTGETQPNVSTLNASTGAITANAAIVPAGTGNEVSLFVSDDADVILDINGYFAPPGTGGLSLYPVTPCRVIDTRQLVPPFPGTLTLSVQGSTCAPPPTAAAYVLNATVVPTGPFPYLTLWPAGESQPYVSTLNAYDGAVTSNMAIVPTNNGDIDTFSPGTGNLILDISSYFAP